MAKSRTSKKVVKSGNTTKTTSTSGGRTTVTTSTVETDAKGKSTGNSETVVESSGGMSPGEHFLTLLLLLALLGVYLNYRASVAAFWKQYVTGKPTPRTPLAVNPAAATGQERWTS